jgi:hypothetical protein
MHLRRTRLPRGCAGTAVMAIAIPADTQEC